MKNLEMEIEKYVQSKHNIWSDRTVCTVGPKLRTLAADFSNPGKNYEKLVRRGYGKYTIKTYFTIAAKFQEDVFRKSSYRAFLQKNAVAFKNCYQEKTRLIKTEEFEKYLMQYRSTNPSMYNLLYLMGAAGLRVSEAMNTKWEDVRDGLLHVVGKGNKQRSIPFNIKKLVRKSLTGNIVGTLAYRFLFQRDLKPFTPHDFRAYYATFIANHPELSIKDAALLLGHSSIQTTTRYVRSDLNRIQKVLNK